MGLPEKTNSNNKATAVHQRGTSPQHYHAPKHYQDGDMELDAIERLKSNILLLDDLQSRLQFMNNELESILGTKKKS